MAIATQLGGASGQLDGLKMALHSPSSCVIPQCAVGANEQAKPIPGFNGFSFPQVYFSCRSAAYMSTSVV